MSMLEILNKENTLQKEQPYKIHFFMENGGWWRAYELSAFLCYEIQKNMGEGNQLKVSKKFMKNYGEYVFVGLKLQSFNKYFPNMDIETMLEDLDDKHITIDVSNLLNESFADGKVDDKYIDWKNNIKLTNKQKETINNGEIQTSINGNTIFGVLQQVLGYPLEDRTPNENTLFIKQLKHQLLKIII